MFLRNAQKCLSDKGYRDSWTAKVVLSSTGAKACTTGKGHRYVKVVKELPVLWVHGTFGRRNVVERWFFFIKHGLRRFYKRFPVNAKYETISSLLMAFIFLYCAPEGLILKWSSVQRHRRYNAGISTRRTTYL